MAIALTYQQDLVVAEQLSRAKGELDRRPTVADHVDDLPKRTVQENRPYVESVRS
jgi:hypothetical protein